MSSDYNGREPGISPLDAEGLMFPADPAWDRKQRRGFGSGKSAPRTAARVLPLSTPPRRIDPEPRSFAPELSATMTPSTLAAEEAPFVAPPVATAPRTTHARKSGPSPVVLAMALGAVVVLGGVGFYAMQPRDGVVTLTPGEPTTSEVAVAPVVTSDLDVASNTLPPRAGPTTAAPIQVARQSAPVARVRPARAAAAPSADDNAANVSATLPDGPLPYTTINPAAPTQVTPPAAEPAPVEAAPTPEETTPPT